MPSLKAIVWERCWRLFSSVFRTKNAVKFQGYSFYRFWVIKAKPTGGGAGVKLPPFPTQIRVKIDRLKSEIIRAPVSIPGPHLNTIVYYIFIFDYLLSKNSLFRPLLNVIRNEIWSMRVIKHSSGKEIPVESTRVLNCISTQPAFTCSTITIETLAKGVKYAQS